MCRGRAPALCSDSYLGRKIVRIRKIYRSCFVRGLGRVICLSRGRCFGRIRLYDLGRFLAVYRSYSDLVVMKLVRLLFA